MLKAVVFDVDGTLVDTVDLHARAWHDAFRQWGKNVPFAEVRNQIGKGGDQILPVFFSEEEIKRVGEELKQWRTEHFKRTYLPNAKPFPKTRELFQALRERGVKIALATSAKKDELKSYKTLANISDLIDTEVEADDVERTKPHPDVFAVALARLGVEPQEAIATGDSPYDAESAGKLGMNAVGVLCGGFPEQWLRAAGCVAIYRDPEDLLVHVDELMSLNRPTDEQLKERKYA